MSTSFSTPPPQQNYATLSFPEQYILLVIFNRPAGLNCMSSATHWELDALFNWYDNEPSLRTCIVTGAGRAFCAGADLKEWNESNKKGASRGTPPSGFGALSRRSGKKPVIAAVNGLAYGGGMEILANIDLSVLARSATLALPEVKRGVVALAGALPRVSRLLSRPRAMEMALTGRTVSSAEALSWGLCNAVVDDAPTDKTTSTDPKDILARPVVQKALEYARLICDNSPDSVIVSRAGVIQGWEDGSAENGARVLMEIYGQRLNAGENIKEGVRAFVEKRKPSWVPSKL